MSNKVRPGQYSDPKGIVAEAFNPNSGIIAEGDTVPTDTTAGYAPGALFFKRAGVAAAQLYINEGSNTSCAFKAVLSQPAITAALAAASTVVGAVAGVAAGYKIARGQQSTVAAADTVVTGLTTVVSAVAVLESDPLDTVSVATCQIGDQAGSPAAGSIIIKTWKPTTGGAAGNPTLIAATVFTKKVNWIAVGT